MRSCLGLLCVLSIAVGCDGDGMGGPADASGEDSSVSPDGGMAADSAVPGVDSSVTVDASERDAALPPSEGIASTYPGDVGLGAHPSVIFFEDFEDPTVETLSDGWDNATRNEFFVLHADTPAGSPAGSQSLRMEVPGGSGTTGVTLYESLPNQEGTVFIRYYARYNNTSQYHHSGMWTGGFGPPTDWPQGTAGIRPNGTDYFAAVFEPVGDGLQFDQYSSWPSMDCWMPDQCYGNNLLQGSRPTVTADAWTCFELMLTLNTPGSSDGELAIWIDGAMIQHLRPGSPNFDRNGVGGWTPNPSGEPFPGFDWRSDPSLGWNFVWLDFYVDGGPSSMDWDQLVVATERVGCIAPAP